MTPEPPEPEARRKGPARPDGAQPLPPRVLVQVGDLEDPAEWDVILVENQDIDDDTARRIAAERAGRPLPPPAPANRLGKPRRPKTVSLPSLDERDVLQAFETDRDAEDADEISVDAFAPPDDGATVVRRPTSLELPPEHDAFAGVPEPGDEVEPEPEAPPTDDEVAFPLPNADDDTPDDDTEVADEPAADAEPAEPWEPAHREGPAVIDDPDDDFYALDDAAADTDEPEPTADTADDAAEPADTEAETDDADDEAAEAVTSSDDTDDEAAGPETDEAEAEADDETEADDGAAATVEAEEPDEPAFDPSATERDLLDDPDADFYEVGRRRPVLGAPIAAAGPPLPLPTPVGDLWGNPSTAPGADDVFEDELEVDSTFPLGPDDLAVDGQVEPVALDSLDYANVFGPVTGSLVVPDLTAVPPRGGAKRSRRSGRGAAVEVDRPGYEDDLYVFEEDAEERWPVAAPRANGRRRELVALGLAAGVIVALGVGSQVFARSDPQDAATGSTSTSSTRVRARTTDTTAPDLTLPTAPSADGPAVPSDDGSTNTTTRRGGTTTTVRSTGPTTPATQPTTTTTAEATTTTTEATTTTTVPDTTTTTAP